MEYNPLVLEKNIRELWKKIKLGDKIKTLRSGKKRFYLLDGPPYVNAIPHVGHIKTTTCKDIWSKFKLMQGLDSYFQPGFDCHGLPVEVMVEKEIGIKSKSDIEKMGIEKFDELCLKKVLNNEKHWMNVYNLLGAWRGFYEPYFTYKNYYIESGWWTLKTLHEKNLLVQGDLPIHWCPHCETALAGYEVSDSYRMVTDPSIYIKFKVKGKNEYFIVFTTTPWTLAGNVALAVHPDKYYVKIKVGNEIYILAEKRVDIIKELFNLDYKIIEKIKGSELEGIEYEPLLDLPQQKELSKKSRKVYMSIPIMKFKKYKKHKLGSAFICEKCGRDYKEKPEICDDCGSKEFSEKELEEFEDFVTVEEGSGIVHTAPGHGATDYLVGEHYKLDTVSPVDESGKFTEKAGEFKGMFVKDADKKIIEKLEKENKLLHHDRITHSYPLCWRCKTPLIFRLSKQWYLKVDPIKENMLRSNEKVIWMPGFGKHRFENWLAERKDWCISQQRYWGIPMPIWTCSCGEIEVIGSVKEMKQKTTKDFGELDDLHRHSVDKIKLRCSCGKEMNRVQDIFNVWYDSGIAPWASLGYPHQNGKMFKELFPCDLIVESQDQIRGWFDSLMFTSMAAFDKSSYESVGMMGWVLDEKGEKMSKSLGNVIWADKVLSDVGGDAIRLYYCLEVAPWEIQKFSMKSCDEIKKSLNILWNLYQFFGTYLSAQKTGKITNAEDKWLVSRINSVINHVTTYMDGFEFHLATRELMKFMINDFSRWYVKLIRDRLDDKNTSYIFYYTLKNITKLLAPITPFITEHIYQDLFKEKESVHLEDWPKADEKLIHFSLEKDMNIIKNIVEASNALRLENGIRLKYILPSLTIVGNEDVLASVKNLKTILLKMANVKDVKIEKEEISYSVKLNYATAGKKFGKYIKKIEKDLEKLDANELKKEIEKKRKVIVSDLTLEKEDLIFKESMRAKGWKDFEGGKVLLDTRVDEKLKEEWLLRELIRTVQQKRKEMNLKVTDKIKLYLPKEFKDSKKIIEGATGSTVEFKKGKDVFEFEGKKYEFGVEK